MLSVRKLIESSYYCMNKIMILIYNLGTSYLLRGSISSISSRKSKDKTIERKTIKPGTLGRLSPNPPLRNEDT